jgi:hypothetical protein
MPRFKKSLRAESDWWVLTSRLFPTATCWSEHELILRLAILTRQAILFMSPLGPLGFAVYVSTAFALLISLSPLLYSAACGLPDFLFRPVSFSLSTTLPSPCATSCIFGSCLSFTTPLCCVGSSVLPLRLIKGLLR